MKFKYAVRIAQRSDIIYCDNIIYYIEQASKDPLNGICKRSKEFIQQKILDGDAVIAVTNRGKWAGFCYVQNWKDGFVSSCALVVHPKYRKGNIARHLKEKTLELAKERYPDQKYFGLTTSLAVMKINSSLSYEPVPFSEITKDENFWAACKSCSNYEILAGKDQKNCLCTAMLHQP